MAATTGGVGRVPQGGRECASLGSRFTAWFDALALALVEVASQTALAFSVGQNSSRPP